MTTLAVAVFTWISIKQVNSEQVLTHEGQITDRYTAAVENLGNDSQDVRLGGVYALQRIMQDSPRDQPAIVDVISAYVRTHATKPKKNATVRNQQAANDVQAAVTVLMTRDTNRDGGGQHVDLHGAYLYDVDDLRGADLHAADLRNTDLRNTDLSNADLGDASLRNARLYVADLSAATLFGADLRGVHLSGADLSGAHLSGADLRGAYLVNANLAYVHAFDFDFGPRRLRSADLRGAYISGANLKGAELRGANLSGTVLKGTDLSGADLRGADLRGADLKAVDLRGSDLKGADLRGSDLRGIPALHMGPAEIGVPALLTARIDHTTKLPAKLAKDSRVKRAIEQAR
ncbi:pentapeptide repeat-containing protein [Streptomyces sp. NPDC056165]|uniref:pentapeptide repeat-containing protein n=1 Tax=Streptomyces sp. NPDC056165 TaxID=3345733 RepID=UPI0035DA5499